MLLLHFRRSPRQTETEHQYSRIKDSPARITNMGGSRYTKPHDRSASQENLILPTPPTSRSASARNGSVKDLERKQYSGSERRLTSETLDTYKPYSRSSLGKRFTEEDVLSETCPPGDTGRYFRQINGREPRENQDWPTGPKHVRQAAPSEDVLSTSSADTQVLTKKIAPKKPERKKLKKAHETSNDMNHLIQEQIKLERELKQLQEIREQLVPPLDLRELNTNHVNGTETNGEQYPALNGQSKRFPNSKNRKMSPNSRLISGPAHSSTRPELTSDESVDREVEGLLREVMLLRDSEDDTSPMKLDHLSSETTNMPQRKVPQGSSPGLLLNGYPSLVHQTNDWNGYMQQSYATPPQMNQQFLSVQRNQTAIPVISQTDKIHQFRLLKKQEIHWMNQIRSRRHILEQKLDFIVRQDVEEQYFYAQEELSRVEKAITDLFQSLSPQEVQWLMKNGVAPPNPDFNRSPYDVHALQTHNAMTPSISYNQVDQQFLPQQQLQMVPYPVASASFVNSMNVPQRFGFQQTNSQPQYTSNFSSHGAGNTFPPGFQETGTNSRNVSRQFQDIANASSPSLVKPPSNDKETQTFNRLHVQNGVSSAQRFDYNSGKLQSSNLERDSRDLGTRTPDMVDSVTVRRPPESGDSGLRSEATHSRVDSADSVTLEREGAKLLSQAVPRQQEDESREGRAREEPNNEQIHSNEQNRPRPTSVKQPSFDDHEVVRLKEKLEHEQRELKASLEREQNKFIEEQRRLKEEEERQNEWIRQQKKAEQENQERMRERLANSAREEQGDEQERSVDEVRK